VKVVAVFGEGSNQVALANRIHDAAPLAHLALVRLKAKTHRKLVRSAVSVTLGRGLRAAWLGMLRHYREEYSAWPDVPSSVHPSANDRDLVDLIERLRPDLILVSGTDLLRKQTLDRFNARVMNLHTGISPYIKGAPNCTNWALALGEFDLIGNTVMWIDAGIDSGALIATERTPLTGRESLSELHIKVMDHAHDLYRRAVAAFVAGSPLPGVPQASIAEGRLFRMRDWNSAAIIRAVANYHLRFRPFPCRPEIKLVSLPERN
jgi:folate-dependent phosphoribosylglycinamide formyltransferase PurN